MNPHELVEQLENRINNLSLRERGILFLAVAMVLYLLWGSLISSPLEKKQQAMLNQIKALRTEISTLDQQAVAIVGRQNVDPNAAERRQLEQLQNSLAEARRQMQQAISGLIEPQQMAKALETVLAQQKSLHFVRIENLGAEPLLKKQDGKASGDEAAIYKHTMRLEMEGSFAQTLLYLRALEELSWQFRWDEMELTMLDYPTARVVVKVHTLSMQRGWLGV
jgi:MSHA biogenesis protein MshJ